MTLCAHDDHCGCAFEAGTAVSFTGTAEPGTPLLVGTHYGIWRPTTPEFITGVVLGDTVPIAQWRTRRVGTHEAELDYRGLWTLAADSQVTGPVFLRIPGGYTADPVSVQHRGQISYFDGANSILGWWSTQANDDTMISFRNNPGGHIGPTVPFTWGAADNIRWDIRGLLVQA